jgi:hypothetical protein
VLDGSYDFHELVAGIKRGRRTPKKVGHKRAA